MRRLVVLAAAATGALAIGPPPPPACHTCAEVKFGSCTLFANEATKHLQPWQSRRLSGAATPSQNASGQCANGCKCAACVPDPRGDARLMAPVAPDPAAAAGAAARVAPGAKPIYLILMVPSYSGSSALEGLLSTSPSVTTMCNSPLHLWECESTGALIKYGVVSSSLRWEPEGTDWAQAYRVFNNISIWDDMGAPIRLEKAPPNIAKSKSLVRFFEAEQMDYRFLVMRRSACLMRHKDSDERRRDAHLLDEVMANGPPSRTLEIQYEDLVVDTRGTAQRIVNWLPQLGRLSLTGGLNGVKPPSEHLGPNRNRRDVPIIEYVQSRSCVVRIQRPDYCSEGPLPKVMPGGHGAVEAHFDVGASRNST